MKGSAVIRMINDFLGESTFRQGITNYLQQKYIFIFFNCVIIADEKFE